MMRLIVSALNKGFRLLAVFACLATFSGTAAAQVNVTSANASSISGTATDSAGIIGMDISLSIGSSFFWDGSQFVTARSRQPVTVTGSTTSRSWSYAISPSLPPGTYFANVRAILATGGALSKSRTIFVDSVRPTSNLALASASTISGTASDGNGVGLNRVEVAIRDFSSPPRHWNGTSFTNAYARQQATLQSNGDWSYTISPALDPGRYVATSFAFDNAGNAQASPFSSKFFLVGDSVRPTSVISSTSATTISGTAADNIAVDRVELAIRNSSGAFFDGVGFGTYERVEANLGGSGNSVTWSYNINPNLQPGNYAVVAIAFDTQGNAQSPFTRQSFTIQAAAQPLRIMAVGDSITEGLNATSYRQQFVSLMNNSSCSYQMVGSLTDNLPATGFQSNHEGYTAHKTDHFLTGRFDGRLNNPGISVTMATHTPDVVMVHLGSNDIYQEPNDGNSVANTIADLDTLISLILNANPNATVLLANVIPWYNLNDSMNISARTTQLSGAIVAYLQANNRPNVRFVNVTAGYTPALMQTDLIHPNAAGDAHIANAFFNALDNSGRCGAPGTL